MGDAGASAAGSGPRPSQEAEPTPAWQQTNRINLETLMAFSELRQYKILPGKMDAWVAFMEETIIPFQVAQGMVITGSYRGEEDESVYVWTRRFESEQEREALYKAVYESDTWTNEIGPQIPEMMDRGGISVIRLLATPRSAAQ
jgi:hypothetical protein